MTVNRKWTIPLSYLINSFEIIPSYCFNCYRFANVQLREENEVLSLSQQIVWDLEWHVIYYLMVTWLIYFPQSDGEEFGDEPIS